MRRKMTMLCGLLGAWLGAGAAMASDEALPALPDEAVLVASIEQNEKAVEAALPARCISQDAEGRFLGWVDYHHCVVSSRAMSAARRFDDMFGDWYDDEASMQLRVVGETIWDERNGTSANARVRASASLPNVGKRFRVVISDDRDDLADSDNNALPARDRDRNRRTTAAIRFIPLALDQLRIDTDIGVRSGPDVYLRARYRNSLGLTRHSVLRFGQTVRYAAEDKGRASTQLDLERLLAEKSVLRFGNSLSYWEQEDTEVGARWGQGLSVAHVLGRQESLGYGVSMDGVTRPSVARESYGLWLVYRRSFWRDWLFYEIEPRLTRYRELNWDTVPSINLRIEAQFGRD